MFYASFRKERLESIACKFCSIVRPHAFYLAMRGTASQELFCCLYSIALIFEEVNKYGPRENIGESDAILKDFLDTGSMGPVKICVHPF